MAKFVRVRYMNIRTGEEFVEEFAKYGKLMGIAARMGMKRLYGSRWEKRYKILHAKNVPDPVPKEVNDAPQVDDES